LNALNYSLEKELEYIREFTNETPKNYQLWQHRQMIIERMGSVFAAEDLEATKVHLEIDAKNIHCWQYRQWILRSFKITSIDEFDYTEGLLARDVYNNSAWNHRMFLIKTSSGYLSDKSTYLKGEFEKILPFLSVRTENNECFWNYLAALLNDFEFMTLASIIESLSTKISPPESTENYLFLRFLSRFSQGSELQSICERLKVLHPINSSFWMTIQ
jgi:protein farnesyltransferase/geranylgeranyltransferase type-1 subunit alpha